MATITNILGTDNITDSRAVINTNFTNLNTDKIEASAIANFETTTQLNARDTANRNRANHTGTQTASTISDFDTEVSNNTDVAANTSARHTHSNKTILDNTTASFTTADETKLDGIEANANNYSLPTASTTTLGGVKVDGTTITITGGVISSTGGGGGSGDVTGPASSTDNGVVLFDGTTGKIIKDSAKTIVTTLGGDNTTIPTSKAVADAIGSAGGGDMLKSVYDIALVEEQLVGLTAIQTLTNKTLDSFTNKIGADHIHLKIKNLTGVTIANGTLIKSVGYESGDEAIRVAPVSSASDVAIGITHGAITQGSLGLAVNTGVATGINTSSLTIGTIYYNNGAGGLTATKPTSGYYQAVAVPLDTKTDGSLLVEFTEPQKVNWDDRYYTETETDTLLSGKENTITAGTTSQYYRGDKTFQTLDKTAVGLSNVDNTSDATKNSATATLTNKTISGASNTLSNIPQSAVTNLTTDLSGKQATLVSGTNIKTINGNSVLGSGDLVISGGSSTKQHRITIPGELTADTSNYQGLYFYNDTGATITISNVAFAVGTAAAGSGAALACNIYKSSGTASDGLNTNAVNLFTSAVSLGTSYTSLTNVPNTTTVEAGRWVTLRVTSSAGATTRASNLQAIISYS